MKKRLAIVIAIAAIALCALTVFSFNVLAENESEAVPGDANGDGVVNSKDLIIIRQYLAWYDYTTGTSSVEINADADVNGDGKIDLIDVAKMRNYLTNGSFDSSEGDPEATEEATEAETENLEPVQDNIFDANDFMAAYNFNTPEGFKGEIVTEDGVTFFRATATEAKDGRLVLNSGENAVANVGKSFVLVYRNKSASMNRVSLEINSAGKTDNVGGATPFYSISKTEKWSAVYFATSNPVDLSAGAGYMSIDIFDEHDNVKVQEGDVIDIALFAAVESTDTAKNTVVEYCGSFVEFPYTIFLNGVYAYGVENTANGVLLSNRSMTNAPVSMDLSHLPISGNLANALRLGSGWAITEGGWDHYECKITASDGTVKTITILSPEKVKDLGENTLNSLTNYDYGADKGVGGNLFDRIAIDLTGYEGKTLTLEVYGISNYGMQYKLADIKNVKIPGVDNTFDAHDFYVSYKNMTSPAYTGELVTENGLTFFRATATASGSGRLTLNSGAKTVENFGKSYILVYRNNSASTSQKFQLYVTAASGASGTMIPAFTKANTSEWKVAVLNYTHDLDMTKGAKSIQVDLFSKDGVAGDVIDVALFVGANSEEEAWKIFGETVGDKIALPFRINVGGGVVVNGTNYSGAPYLTSKTTMDNGPAQFDLSSVPAVSGDLKTAFRLGASWAITREGWDYYYCNIIAESGKTATVRASEGYDFAAGAYTAITQNATYLATHGPNMAIGGDITTKAKSVYVDLTGFEGETVTLEIFGVSNYGMHYEIVHVKNLQIGGTPEYEELDDFVSFVDPSLPGELKILSLSGGNTAGVSFTVPEGEEVRSLKIALSNTTALKACSAGISVYAFNGSYAESVKTTPVFTTTATSVMKWVDIAIPDGTMPAGDYLVVVKYVPVTGGVFTSAILDNAWSTLPESLAKYNIVAYRNGEIDSEKVLAGGFETVTVGATVPANDKIDVAFEDTTAKVIVISGQSNAAGATSSSIFKSKIGAEEYAKYANGFSNVKILYKCGNNGTTITYNNVSNGFVDVKIGQGYLTSTFGPELGLAAYLAENYPDETFYIIKYAVGSTSMQGHFNVNSSSDSQKVCLNGLKETVDNGLKLIEEMGLTPKIVGFLWMQGEGDAGTHANRASGYYTMQKALMSYLRDTYSDYSVDDGEIPFIDAEISDSGFWGASYVVNDFKKDIDRESARNYLIDTNYVGLTTLYENNDRAHYDSGSMILLGELYAKTICNIYDFSK